MTRLLVAVAMLVALAHAAQVAPRRLQGYEREQSGCDAQADVSEHPAAAYDACMAGRRL